MNEEARRAFRELKARQMTAEAAVEALQAIFWILELRGYDVRGKTLDEIKQIIRDPPASPTSEGRDQLIAEILTKLDEER